MDKKCKRRLITLLLSLTLIISYMPTSFLAYAVDDDPAVTQEEQTGDNGGADGTEDTGSAKQGVQDTVETSGAETPEGGSSGGTINPEVNNEGTSRGESDPEGNDCSGNHETDITDKYHVKWRFSWSNGGGSAGGSYEFKDPNTGAASEDHTYLFYHPQTWNNQNANLMVELTFSGEEDQSIKAGAIEIRIPLSVFKGWDGKSADKIVTQVPKAPEQNAQSNFNYEIDEENQEIVIHNFNEISGNDYLSVEFSYNVSPLDINGGMPDETAARADGFTDPTYGLGAAAGSKDIDRYCWNNNGRYMWKDFYRNEGFNCSITLDPDLDGTADYYDMKNPLSVAMATRAGGTTKTSPMPDQKSGVYTSWQSTWGTKPSDADQFVYVVWNINYTTLTNYNVNQDRKSVV